MAKEIKEIIKKDANFDIKKLDLKDSEILAKIEEILKIQEDILNRKKVDEQNLKLVIQL